MWLYLIRHGATKGNKEGRYVGSTDEELTREAVTALKEYRQRQNALFSKTEMVVVSPLRRCRQTADILFPEIQQYQADAFRECDFGEFEYRNYQELDGNPFYQRFIDTFGKSGFPGGENRDAFQKRCVSGFERMMLETDYETVALVIHGGTIMALLDWYSNPHKDYYDWQAANGTGFAAKVVREQKNGRWQLEEIRKI